LVGVAFATLDVADVVRGAGLHKALLKALPDKWWAAVREIGWCAVVLLETWRVQVWN